MNPLQLYKGLRALRIGNKAGKNVRIPDKQTKAIAQAKAFKKKLEKALGITRRKEAKEAAATFKKSNRGGKNTGKIGKRMK